MKIKIEKEAEIIDYKSIIGLTILAAIAMFLPLLFTKLEHDPMEDYKVIYASILRPSYNTQKVVIEYTVDGKTYEQEIIENLIEEKKDNKAKIYYNVKNPKTIVQIPLEKAGVKEEVLISILLVTGVLILYVGLLGVFNKKPKKAGVNTVLQVFGIAGFVLIYSGVVMIISINESFNDYLKVKATVLTSIEGNESSVDFTEVEYEIDGVRYVNSMETYNSTHYKGKKVKMYVNKEDYNQIKPPADYINSIVPIIVGAFLVIIGNIPLVKKIKEKKLKKRLMQEGEYRRVKVVSLKYDKKIKINGTFPQFAEVELIEDEKTFTFKSDSYVNLIAYSQEKQLLEADLYFDPMDNRNYVIIFDFEKKTKSV